MSGHRESCSFDPKMEMHPATPHNYTVMKTILSLLLLASSSSLPQEEIEALVAFREVELTRLTEQTAALTANVERLDAEIMDIEAQIVGLQEQRTLTIATKAKVNEEIAAPQEMIEENQERLEELRD